MNCECGCIVEAVEAWSAAAALHREAHGQREPFLTCPHDSCLALKDALRANWREYRPAVI